MKILQCFNSPKTAGTTGPPPTGGSSSGPVPFPPELKVRIVGDKIDGINPPVHSDIENIEVGTKNPKETIASFISRAVAQEGFVAGGNYIMRINAMRIRDPSYSLESVYNDIKLGGIIIEDIPFPLKVSVHVKGEEVTKNASFTLTRPVDENVTMVLTDGSYTVAQFTASVVAQTNLNINHQYSTKIGGRDYTDSKQTLLSIFNSSNLDNIIIEGNPKVVFPAEVDVLMIGKEKLKTVGLAAFSKTVGIPTAGEKETVNMFLNRAINKIPFDDTVKYELLVCFLFFFKNI